MKKYILTGTPGSGKTTLIKHLASLGYPIVEEAATEVINHLQARGEPTPWTQAAFIEQVVQLQIQRRQATNKSMSASTCAVQFFDRSPLCTLALAKYLSFTPPITLIDEINLIKAHAIYEKRVFFIENLGYCEPTEARKISFEESLRFEKIHEVVYLEHGFELVKIRKCSVGERAQLIIAAAHARTL